MARTPSRSVATAMAMTCAMAVGLAACTSGHAPADTIVFTLSSDPDPLIGELTLARTRDATAWTLESIDESGTREVLLQGRGASETFEEVAAELVANWLPPTGSNETGVYRVRAQILSGDRVLSEHERNSNPTGDLSVLMPASEGFRQIWDVASGIPKMYWFRHIGPFHWEGAASSERLRDERPSGAR